jgi:hypothetical protein
MEVSSRRLQSSFRASRRACVRAGLRDRAGNSRRPRAGKDCRAGKTCRGRGPRATSVLPTGDALWIVTGHFGEARPELRLADLPSLTFHPVGAFEDELVERPFEAYAGQQPKVAGF